MLKSYFFTLLLFFFTPFVVFPQEDTITSIFDLTLEDLINIKVSGVSKSEENIYQTPQTIVVIEEEELLKRGYTDLEQVLHDLPGFDFSRGYGTQYSQIYQRGYRSNNTERTLLLIDGVEQNDLWSNSVWLSRQIPLSNIKRIEIIYGPASTIYGANAFVGVINIVTKNPKDFLQDKHSFFSVHSGYGSWNTKYIELSAAGGGDKFAISSTMRYFYSDGMDISSFPDWDYNLDDYDMAYYKKILNTSVDSIALLAMELDRNAYYNDTALHGQKPHYSNTAKDFSIDLKIQSGDFTFGFNKFIRNEGFGAWYRDDYELGTDFGAKWVPNNGYVYSYYSKDISNKLKFVSFNRFKSHKLDNSCKEYYFTGFFNGSLKLSDLLDSNYQLLPDSLMTLPRWNVYYYFTYSNQFRSEQIFYYDFSSKLKFFTGIDIKRSFIQGEYFTSTEPYPEEIAEPVDMPGGNHFSAINYGLYFQTQYAFLKSFFLIAGGRWDYNKIRVHGGFGLIFNPKLALIYSKDNFSVKAIYSEAFQDASFWTKYSTIPGRLLNNPNLKPEKVRNTEVNFQWKINNNLFWNLAAYNAHYYNAVSTVAAVYINENNDTIHTTQHQAVGRLIISGIQTNLRFQFKNYSIFANYTFTAPYQIEDNNFIRIGDIASHKANIGINASFFNKLNINLRGNYVGMRPTGKNTSVATNPLDKIDPYFILNGSIGYFTKSFYMQLIINNILDKQYFDPGVRSADGIYYAAKIPQYRRNFMFKLGFNL